MGKREAGFTLVEVIIAAVITAVMMLAILGIFTVGQDACSVGGANLAVQLMNTKSFAEMTRMMRESRIVAVAADGASITLQKPVADGTTGEVVDVDGNINWGAIWAEPGDPSINPDRRDWYLRYVYVQDRIFTEAAEGMDGIDLNRDGRINRNFSIGYIAEEIYDDHDVRQSWRPITPPYIVATDPNPGGDVDGNGSNDPLFVRVDNEGLIDNTGQNIRISFFAFKPAEKDRTVLLHPTCVVSPRNF